MRLNEEWKLLKSSDKPKEMEKVLTRFKIAFEVHWGEIFTNLKSTSHQVAQITVNALQGIFQEWFHNCLLIHAQNSSGKVFCYQEVIGISALSLKLSWMKLLLQKVHFSRLPTVAFLSGCRSKLKYVRFHAFSSLFLFFFRAVLFSRLVRDMYCINQAQFVQLISPCSNTPETSENVWANKQTGDLLQWRERDDVGCPESSIRNRDSFFAGASEWKCKV